MANLRAVHAIYQAWILKETGAKRVLEIGAGLGRNAYYARHMGIEHYTIVDLPLTNVSQAHYLSSLFGVDVVSLTGEEKKHIHISSPDEFLCGGLGEFDVILNVDSFTEMDTQYASAYLDVISRSSPLFLSANHEVNGFTVSELAHAHPATKSIERQSYWMRRGYVLERVTF